MRQIESGLAAALVALVSVGAATVHSESQGGPAAADTLATPKKEANFWEASKFSLDVRLRYEGAKDELLPNADALTLRSGLRWTTGPIGKLAGLSGLVELENTAVLSATDYTDGVRNRGTILVADSPSTEFNQAYLAYQTPNGLRARIGRQEISYGDERFVGSVAFRQNHQSFDAAAFEYSGRENWLLSYAYVTNVNRIFGSDAKNADNRPAGLFGDHKQNTHLINAVYKGWSFGELETYAYLIDNEDLARASTNTYGARFAGRIRPARLTYFYTLELARQRSRSNNPVDYHATYWRAVGGISLQRLSVQFSQERLGANNDAGFITPFATLHRYQGWADKFAALTPNEGLIANSITVAGRWPGFRYRFQYHNFDADKGSANFGHEFGAQLQYRFKLKYFAEIKYADYRAQDAAAGLGGVNSDTRRLFLSITARLGKK